MLRINSTTTKAVTAFDIMDLCIVFNAVPRSGIAATSGARIVQRNAFTVE